MGYEECDRCGATYRGSSDHQEICPGSPDERIEALESKVANLEEQLAALREQIEERNRP